MIRPGIADHGAMVAAIIATRSQATAEQATAGAHWYPTAGRMVAAIAESAGTSQHRVAHALAALSPRNPWRWNVADAYAFAHAAVADPAGAIPAATTFTVNRVNAWRALTADGAPWTTAASKVRSFVEAILGDTSAVVVDVWAIRVATAGALDTVREHEYAAVVAAYQDAAVMIGESPRDLQAITWLVAQAAGLGSNRRGDHTATFKRGTAPAVVALFEQDGE